MYRMNMKGFGVGRKTIFKQAAVVVLLSLFGTAAQAVTVFSENFEGYNFTSGGPTNAGIPKISEGAQEIWYAARFQAPNDGGVGSDLAVVDTGGGSNGTHVGRFEDDAGLLFKLDTTSLDSVTLSFDWGTDKTSTTDKLVVGYHIGPISGFGSCTGNGETGCFADLQAGSATPLPWYTTEGGSTLTGNWTQLLSGNSPVGSSTAGWQSTSFLLPEAIENQSVVWFAFWLNDGNSDIGLIDNVLVTAVPEAKTYTMMLAGLGLIGFTVLRRRSIY